MDTRIGIFSCVSGFFAVFGVACAAGVINPRSSDSQNAIRQSVGFVQSRNAANRSRSVSPVRGAVTDAGAVRVRTVGAARDENSLEHVTVRSGTAPVAVSRVARALKMNNNSRAARNMTMVDAGLARSGIARATAVFSDVSKIGSGYAACRESYATCMDQMCAQANDTYRRCFCSDRFMQFRDTENALDQAMIMLQQFQDNNLNAVDKTAAEVEAMYSATVGEQAIKRDTSAAAQMLDEINNLLSGKKSTTLTVGSSGSLGVLDLDFSSDLGDIWSVDNTSSIFASGGTDLSMLEGTALFNAAQNQCVRLSQNNCDNDAVFSMSKSSYNILITQDCNIYEKTLNTKREKVAAAVRTAEKYLREARLEEYRAHNSADVNACITAVRNAVLADTACGENYKRCLDPTGAYIDTNGNAIYTPRLFELENTIALGGWDTNQDVLTQNPRYEKFLDGYRKYVTRELDTCRDIADFVWTEFKRNAIIEIAQAQSEKIQEVKSSCVNTIAQCYNSKTQSLVNMDKNTATAAGVLGRYASIDMCKEDVAACALLYSRDKGSCEFDGRGHINNSETCGLQSLLDYVDAVDSLNLVDKCVDAVDEYVTELCTPTTGTYGYPYDCRSMYANGTDTGSIDVLIKNYASKNCSDDGKETSFNNLDLEIQTRIQARIDTLRAEIRASLAGVCESMDGMWYNAGASVQGNKLIGFYNTVSARNADDPAIATWGTCYENSDQIACLSYNTGDEDTQMTSWNSTTETCTFYDEWYEYMCTTALGGYYDANMCYVPND